MINRLFVYGTLAPGQSNEHILSEVQGSWEPASVKGKRLNVTWGPAAGYPGVFLHNSDGEVQGLVFTSEDLPAHWARLDAFEGEGYTRTITTATLQDGSTVEAYIYQLNAPKAL